MGTQIGNNLFNECSSAFLILSYDRLNDIYTVKEFSQSFLTMFELKDHEIVNKDIETVIPQFSSTLWEYSLDANDITYFAIKNSAEFQAYGFQLANQNDIVIFCDGKSLLQEQSVIDQTLLKFIDYSFDYNSKGLLQQIIDEIESITYSQVGFYLFLDSDQNNIKQHVYSSNTVNLYCHVQGKRTHYSLQDAGAWAEAYKAKKTIIHNDYNLLSNKKGLPTGHVPIKRELVVPIFKNDKIVAIVGVGNKQRPYSQKDVRLVTKLAEKSWEIVNRKLNAEVQLKPQEFSMVAQQEKEAIAKYELIKPISLYSSIPDQKQVLRENLVLTECNDVFLKMHNVTERKEILFQKLTTLYDESTIEKKISFLSTNNYNFKNFENVEILQDGSLNYTLSSSSSIIESNLLKGIWITKVDLSAQKKLENELQHLQRVDSLGMIASGLGHDFNNILAGILGNVDLINLDLTNLASVQKSLRSIKNAVYRGKDITNQLLDFSRKNESKIKSTSIDEIIDSAVKIALPGSKSKCIIHIENDLPKVKIDSGQIYQVLTNLLINADQALENGGEIVLTASKITIENPFQLKKGDYIQVTVKDNGSGIPYEIRDKIFSPFVSTKGEKGLGIGLATCRSILRRHEGLIEFTSEIGLGTEFKIYLPITTVIESVTQELEDEPKIFKKGKILVLDDDDTVKDVLKKFLEQLGQKVITTSSSNDAIRLFRNALESNEKFDLVFLDLIIPGDTSGSTVLAELLELDPTIIGVVSSGSKNELEFREFAKYGFREALSKPFTFLEIQNLVSSLLGI